MGKTYAEKLAERVREAGNPVCVGMDPVAGKIPGEGPLEERIKRFYSSMLDAMLARDLLPAAVKPNMAYYESVSLGCLQVLKDLIEAFRDAGVLVILDAKRGDIASTSGAYARSAFKVFGADAVTAAPYMGIDTIKPFQEESQGQGIYVLVRTSNPSARDFQDLRVGPEGEPLYRVVAARLADWNDGNLGAVVGATAPRELAGLLAYWKGRGREVPVLIPGVAIAGVSGGQTGSVSEVYGAIRDSGSNPDLHLINSSSGINYAYEKFPALTPEEASVQALDELCEAIARAK
jgi:orotidine-5'-phosphate decarboxylase